MVSSANNQRDFTEAMVAFWQGDYVEAVRLFNQVAAAQPQDTAVKLLLASAQKQAGQLLEARHTYDTILKTASDPEELESARRGLEELLQMAPELADVPSPAQEDKLQPQGEFPPQPEEADPFPQFEFEAMREQEADPFAQDLFSMRSDSFAADEMTFGEEESFADPFETRLEMEPADPFASSHPLPANPQVTPPAVPGETALRAGREQPQTDPVVDDDFAFLSEFDRQHLQDLDSDSITQLAGDAAFPEEMGFSLPTFGEEEVGSLDEGLPTELATPMSEPIPAPEEDTAGPGPALFELNELDSLDRELAGMEGGEVPVFSPDEGETQEAGGTARSSPTISMPLPVKCLSQFLHQLRHGLPLKDLTVAADFPYFFGGGHDGRGSLEAAALWIGPHIVQVEDLDGLGPRRLIPHQPLHPLHTAQGRIGQTPRRIGYRDQGRQRHHHDLGSPFDGPPRHQHPIADLEGLAIGNLRDPQPLGQLGPHLGRVAVSGLEPAEDDIGLAGVANRVGQGIGGGQGIRSGQAAVGHQNAPIHAVGNGLVEHLDGRGRPHGNCRHPRPVLPFGLQGRFQRIAIERVEHPLGLGPVDRAIAVDAGFGIWIGNLLDQNKGFQAATPQQFSPR